MKQSEVFRDGEGDAWYNRNVENLIKITSDSVIDLIVKYTIPQFVYEVGCSNGWRLRRIKERWDCNVGGIDPSRAAINRAAFDTKNIYYGSARRLHGAEDCDVLIYGFCLYLCDPEDYFEIVMEGDRVLKDGGYLIIHDFDTRNIRPRRIPYKHKEGLYSHHVTFERLWSGHPWYCILETQYRDDQVFTILKKDSGSAWE